jgi:hypothetical protein
LLLDFNAGLSQPREQQCCNRSAGIYSVPVL